ncbi:unnamed protein product, partial [Ectocarpus sp. 8 AP-2014]
YLDPQNRIQGPFDGSEMRQWFEAGYFQRNLPVRRGVTGEFIALERLFPGQGATTAFLEASRGGNGNGNGNDNSNSNSNSYHRQDAQQQQQQQQQRRMSQESEEAAIQQQKQQVL